MPGCHQSALLSTLWACCALASAVNDVPVLLAADSPHLQYTGRVARNGSQVLWEWPGIKVGTRLSCPAGPLTMQVHIKAPKFKLPLYSVHEFAKYSVLVDGIQVVEFQTTADDTTYNVTLPGSTSTTLLLEVFKATERIGIPMYWGFAEKSEATAFSGITIPASCTPLAPPTRPARRLEFIGDSITCGFGNLVRSLVDNVKCANPPGGWLAYENFSLAIPTIASKEFNAETHTQCISNVGITRNGMTTSRTTEFNMSHYIHRTLPTVPDGLLEWDYSTWTPDLAVVNLGTNDYDISQYFHIQPSFADFEGNYTNFLSGYVSRYAGRLPAMLVLCGPMTKSQCPSVKRVASALNSSFPSLHVRYLEVDSEHLHGCLTHPDSTGDREVYEQIAPVIGSMTGWEVSTSTIMV